MRTLSSTATIAIYLYENGMVMFSTKVRGAAVGGLLGALALMVTVTPSASAASGLLWLGEHQNMGGKSCGWAGSQPNLRNTFCFFNDKASSVRNSSDSAWVLYDDSNYADRRYCIYAGQRINNLHGGAWNFGDKISSIKRLSGNSCAGYPTF